MAVSVRLDIDEIVVGMLGAALVNMTNSILQWHHHGQEVFAIDSKTV